MDKKRIIISLAILLITALLSVSLYYFQKSKTTPKNDEFLERVMKRVGKIKSYSQHVETETITRGGEINIIGDYDINKPKKAFRSQSKTTTFAGTDSKQEFTLINISIRDNIYTKIETDSELVKSRMPETNKWHHFTAGEISVEYQNIAIHGPIVDNLRLFAEKGRYLDVIEHKKNRYTFKLSKEAFGQNGKLLLGTIVDRIGKNGTINVWVNEQTFEIVRMEFNNPPYHSVTEILNINEVPQISAPVL